MIFYLGTHIANWIGKLDIPLFISRRIIYKRRTFPRAVGKWALDSGGFSELSMYGHWETSPKQYATEVKKFSEEIGNMDFAAIQDWMCEPFIIQKTGYNIKIHQEKTIDSFFSLNELQPSIPWIPILQGFELSDYLQHIDQYINRGIDLTKFSTVGIGSICRRQHTQEAEEIIRKISQLGINLHGFGFKIVGLGKVSTYLKSSDSMAWSFAGRRSPPLPGHTHKNCANCLEYALQWRDKLFSKVKDIN